MKANFLSYIYFIVSWNLIYFLLIPLSSYAKLPTPHPQPLSISLQQMETPIKVQEKNQIKFQLKLIDGYRAYLDKFQIKSKNPKNIEYSSIQVEPTIVFYDKFFDKEQEGLVGQGELSAQFQIPEGVDVHQLDGWLVYQACTDDFCLLPKEIPFSLHVTSNFHTIPGFQEALSRGIFWAFLLVFMAGFLTSLTPCFFPMIPITLSVLGTQAIGQSRLKSFFLSLCYVLGMGITYALLGVMAATTGSLFGSLLANPLVIITIAIVFVLMGLSMYGVFEVKTPDWMQKRFGQSGIGKGFKGVFIAGLMSGVIASPCVGPVLIGLLTYVSQTQDIVMGFLLLLTFAMGLGVLFLLLGTFSQLINQLPKSGAWMESVKFLFGTTMIAMAFYYLNFTLDWHYLKILLGLSCFFVGLQLYWKFRKATSSYALYQFRKVLSGTCYLMGILLLLTAFFDLDALLKSPSSGTLSQDKNDTKIITPWQDFSNELFQSGLSENRPMIIDFTAQWCGVCKALEMNTFSDVTVQVELKKFLLLQVDATTETNDVAQWTSQFKVLGLPTLLFYDQEGILQEDLTLTHFEDPQPFLQRLKKVLN